MSANLKVWRTDGPTYRDQPRDAPKRYPVGDKYELWSRIEKIIAEFLKVHRVATFPNAVGIDPPGSWKVWRSQKFQNRTSPPQACNTLSPLYRDLQKLAIHFFNFICFDSWLKRFDKYSFYILYFWVFACSRTWPAKRQRGKQPRISLASKILLNQVLCQHSVKYFW